MTTPTAAPAAPTAPSNAAPQAPSTPTPQRMDGAGGQQMPANGQPRDPNGKFAPKPGEKAPEPQPKPKLRIKDIELDEDAAYAEIQRARQAGKHLTEAQKRVEKAEALERQRQERLARYRDDADALFEDLGITDPEARAKWASQYLYKKHIEPSQMSEEQRELARLRDELAKRDAEKSEAEKKAEQEALDRDTRQAARQLQQEVGTLIESGQVPKSPLAVKRIAEKIRAAEANGLSLTASDAWAAVQEDYNADTRRYLTTASVEDLQRELGADFKPLAQKFIQWALAKTKAAPGLPPARGVSAPAPQPKSEIMTPQEFEELRRAKR